MIVTDLKDTILAGFCAKYHIAGEHKADLCPLPKGYCNMIGLLSRTIKEQEDEIKQLSRLSTPTVISAGGAGGSSAGAAGNGGNGYFGGVGGAGGAGGKVTYDYSKPSVTDDNRFPH